MLTSDFFQRSGRTTGDHDLLDGAPQRIRAPRGALAWIRRKASRMRGLNGPPAEPTAAPGNARHLEDDAALLDRYWPDWRREDPAVLRDWLDAWRGLGL